MKKKIIIVLLVIALVGGLVFADNCKYYSTNPGDIYLKGLSANLSGRIISVSSSINEPVKITSIKIGSDELVWNVTGSKRLDAFGDTTLTVSGTKKLSGTLVIQAESCD